MTQFGIGDIQFLKLLDDGKTAVAFTSKNYLFFSDCTNGKIISNIKLPFEINAYPITSYEYSQYKFIDVSPDGNLLVGFSNENNWIIWDIKKNKKYGDIKIDKYIRDISFTNDSKVIYLFTDEELYAVNIDPFNVNSINYFEKYFYPYQMFMIKNNSALFRDRSAILEKNLINGYEVKFNQISKGIGEYSSLSISNDKKQILEITRDGVIKTWEINQEKLISEVNIREVKPECDPFDEKSITFSPDVHLLLCENEIYDTNSGRKIDHLFSGYFKVKENFFSEKGDLIISLGTGNDYFLVYGIKN